ncbi:hypothetical protein E2C01_052015 [Portunus trituberculatus]|uniref:Uncharacterized protein n=1 Tax=Portunus trituberculatus TaxID=210409 RepID=A0A5B7GKK1_PORTR|nr:hypothetical protein [Portunus trituberculatus]
MALLRSADQVSHGFISLSCLVRGYCFGSDTIVSRLLDIASVNCHVIYKANGGQKCFLDLELKLIEELFKNMLVISTT